MGKKTNQVAAKAKGSPPSKAEFNRLDWAQRHPERAKEERAMRVARHDRQKRYGHKRGPTVETMAHLERRQAGALARLFASGAIDADQLAAGEEIATVAERIMRDVAVRTADYGTRVDRNNPGGAFWEALGAVRMEVAYSAWRAELGPAGAMVLAIVVDDQGIVAACREARMDPRRGRTILIGALDAWILLFREARKSIDMEELLDAQARLI